MSRWLFTTPRSVAMNKYFPPLTSDRRREPRYSIQDPVKITVLLPPELTEVDGHATDLSKDGIGVLVDHEIKAGSIIEVILRTTSIIGEVRDCQAINGRYRLCVSITDMRMGIATAAAKSTKIETTVARG